MALTNKEKQAALRKRRAELGQKRREFWMIDNEYKALKPKILEMLKVMRESN